MSVGSFVCFLIAALLVIPIGSASAAEPGPTVPPYPVIDVATSPTENERHPAAAYNPGNRYWVAVSPTPEMYLPLVQQ